MPSAKTAHGSKTEADILTRRVCEECGVHIPQNELATVLKIVLGARGQQTDKHYETTHLPGPCGRAKAAAAQSAAEAAVPTPEPELVEVTHNEDGVPLHRLTGTPVAGVIDADESGEVGATEAVEEVAAEEVEFALEPALA